MQNNDGVGSFQANDLVEIQWGQRWWNGRIVRAVSEQRWEIAYDGYDTSWNEVVGPERLRARGAAPAVTTQAPAVATVATQTQQRSQLLTRTLLFLLGVRSGVVAQAAAREGFTAAELEEGWRLFEQASQLQRTFAPALHKNPAEREELRSFLSVWSLRVQAATERYCTRSEERERVLEATMPAGTANATISQRVERFLDGLHSLSQGAGDGAASVVHAVRARGLSEEYENYLRSLCQQERSLAAASEDDVAANDDQKVFDALERWFTDWATVLTPRLSEEQRASLGITAGAAVAKTAVLGWREVRVVLTARGAVSAEPAPPIPQGAAQPVALDRVQSLLVGQHLVARGVLNFASEAPARLIEQRDGMLHLRFDDGRVLWVHPVQVTRIDAVDDSAVPYVAPAPGEGAARAMQLQVGDKLRARWLENPASIYDAVVLRRYGSLLWIRYSDNYEVLIAPEDVVQTER